MFKKLIAPKHNIPQTHPVIFKRPLPFKKECVESTPIKYKDQLLIVCFDRPAAKPYGSGWSIYELLTNKLIANGNWAYGLGCAYVNEDKIILIGTSQWDQANAIFLCELDSNFKMGEIKEIWKSKPDQSIYNTSLCKAENGYIMAYEVREPNTVPFSIRFLHSSDLITWKSIGQIFHPDIYAACPTVRFVNNWYYILYLRSFHKHYVMSIARTKDFNSYEDFIENPKYPGNYQVLSSVNSEYEGINNSDVDLVEFQGMTYIIYADGDQRTWANLRLAFYPGPLTSFYHEFWPD